MCFSPQVSFATALALAVIGKFTHDKAQKKHYYLAMIPWLFAIQQAAEGAVWITLQYWPETNLNIFFSYIFLLFAYLIWPIWIPWSLEHCEKNKHAQQSLRVLRYVGTVVSLLLGIYMIRYGVSSEIAQCHIAYNITIPTMVQYIVFWGYLFPVIGSFFISTMPYAWWAGIILAISCFASYYIWYTTFTSVWCFFAALLSIGLYALLSQKKR